MENITLEYLLTHSFEKTGLEEEKEIHKSGMFTEAELGLLPRSDEEKIFDLKVKMSDYIHKIGGYKKVFVDMNLNPETTLIDAVVVHCIQNRYNISQFIDVCDQVHLDADVKS